MKPVQIFYIVVLMSLALTTRAHHAAAPHYHLDQTIVLEGIITELKLVNPHSFIYLDVTDDDGVTSNWRCSMTTTTRLTRRGWTADTLTPGQRVTLTGSPARREENHCFFRSLEFQNGVTITSGEDITGKVGPAAESVASAGSESASTDVLGEYVLRLPNGQPNLTGPWIVPPLNIVPGSGKLGKGVNVGLAFGLQEDGLPEPTAAGQRAAEGYDVIYDNPALMCLPSNIVTAWAADGAGNTIYQEEDQITLQYGYMDLVRIIHLDLQEHPETTSPSLAGHSIGHWEGDTLVVHTTGFQPGILFSDNGRMHSERMEITERFELVEGGQKLARQFTVHDPAFLQGDWVGEDVLSRTDEPQDPYDCISLEGANNERGG